MPAEIRHEKQEMKFYAKIIIILFATRLIMMTKTPAKMILKLHLYQNLYKSKIFRNKTSISQAKSQPELVTLKAKMRRKTIPPSEGSFPYQFFSILEVTK